jgi:PAS domain S-box-containing protein
MEEPVGSFDGLDGSGFVAVLDGLPELVSFWDRDQRCLFANAAAAAAFGRSAGGLREVPLGDVLGTHGARLMLSRFLSALKGEGSEQERALFDGEGELRQYRTTYTPVCIDEVVIGVAIVLVDITEELNTQAQIFRDSLQVARLTERHRVMVTAGSEVLARLRRTLDELQPPIPGDQPGAHLHRLAEELRNCTRRLREGTRASPPASEDGTVSNTVPTTAPSTVSTSPLSVDRRNSDGGLLAAASSAQACFQPSFVHRTARLEAEVFALLDQLPVVITVWDRTRSLRYANRAAEAVLAKWGHTRATGRRLEQIVSEDFLRVHEAHAEDVLHGRTQSFHRRQISPDGQEHHFHVRYVPRIADGEVIGAFAYASDITDAMKAGEELIAARSAYAALQERQAIEDRLHQSILQELFAAAMLLDTAARAGGDMPARVEESRTYLQMALDGLTQLS